MYTYENAAGQRFAVYCFNAQESFETGHDRGLFRSVCRANQLRRILPWLSRRELDAVCTPAPDMYMMVKKDASSLSVALWNFGPDTIRRPTVTLSGKWNSIECNWGKAVLEGSTVTVPPIAPYSCAVFTCRA